MRKLFSIVALLVFLTLPALAQLALFPTPAKVSGGKGSFTVGIASPVTGNGGYADQLAKKLPSELKGLGLSGTPSQGTIRLVLDEKLRMPDEAYALTVTPESVLLEASSESGLLLTRERLDSLLASGLHSATISLDGFEEAHNWLRRHPKSFENAVNAICMLAEEKEIVWDVVTCIPVPCY